MISFLLSPFMSFFSARLYRSFLQSGAGRGFLYLIYLTCLFCLLVLALCQLFFLPLAGSFLDWLIHVTPEMTVSESGLSAKVTQPYLVRHPSIGPLYLIDTTKSASELLKDESGAFLLIGKEELVARQPQRNEIRVINIRDRLAESLKSRPTFTLTKSMMQELSRRVQSMILPIVLVFLAPIFFIWKLFVVLFYSLAAVLLNLFRKQKFRYRSLFSLSCYAVSPVTLIQAVSLTMPNFGFSLNWLLAFALTVSYLAYGMFAAPRGQEETAVVK